MAALLAAGAALAQVPLVPAGQGPYTWFGLTVYEARLSIGAGFRAARFAQHAFALELTYRRALRGSDIARRSLEEMRRLGTFSEAKGQAWEQSLRQLLPDVSPGDRITGLNQPGRGAAFSVNGRPVGEVTDPEFAALFFAIWLSPDTPEPTLRAALLANAPP